jgi:hypothetical protein
MQASITRSTMGEYIFVHSPSRQRIEKRQQLLCCQMDHIPARGTSWRLFNRCMCPVLSFERVNDLGM